MNRESYEAKWRRTLYMLGELCAQIRIRVWNRPKVLGLSAYHIIKTC